VIQLSRVTLTLVMAAAAFVLLRNSGAEPARAPAPTSTVKAGGPATGQPPNT
jgi:hypothetical protein